MTSPDKESKTRDELYWLFPILMILAIIGVGIIVQPQGCGRGNPQSYGSLPEGAPEGIVTSVYQGESQVVIPDVDGTGVKTGDDLSELMSDDLYTSEEEPDSEGTFEDSVTPGPGLKIVVRSDIEEEGNSDIYLLDETGYNPVRLTDWDSVESFPAITSDGKWVYFVSDYDDDPNNPNPFTKNTEIYVIDMEAFESGDYDGPDRLTYNNETDYGISVSADGSKMVFMSATKENPDNPKMILADGSAANQKVIADTYLKNAVPKISGDGNKIVYNSFLDGEMDIYLYDVPGKFTINLTNSDIPEYFPAINYDGSFIVYEKLLGINPQNEGYIELFACNPDGSNERQITRNRFADTFPAITDNGEWIVFVSKRWDFNGDDHYDETLFYMDASGENVYKITKDPFYQEQPDV